MKPNIYPMRTTCAFLIILLLMPLGHALMIIMDHLFNPTALHFSAFALGFIGMSIVILGVYQKNDSKATICGLAGGLLFWTGWVEFLFSYYAWRYGVHCDLTGSGIVSTSTQYIDGMAVCRDFLINGAPLEAFDRPTLKALRGSRPEYLIMPATFGMWMMIVMLYLFCTRTGCRFFLWLQDVLKLPQQIALKPITRLPAMVTFLQLNMMMWGCYLLLMFCYDPVFLGDDHWFTFCIGFCCLIGSIYIIRKQLRIRPFGANLRMAIAAVIVFWTFVEIIARNGILKEIWVDPFNHLLEMSLMFIILLVIIFFSIIKALKCETRARLR